MPESWIEMPKPKTASADKLKPDQVAIVLRQTPGGKKGAPKVFFRARFGAKVAELLGWEKDYKLRIQWAADGSKVKIDEAQSHHPHAYLLREKSEIFSISTPALPPAIAGDPVEAQTAPFKATPQTRQDEASLVIDLPQAFRRKKAA